MKDREKEMFLEQLRYRFRREAKLSVIREIEEQEESEGLVSIMPPSLLQRKRNMLQMSFGAILGLYLGLFSVLLAYAISRFW